MIVYVVSCAASVLIAYLGNHTAKGKTLRKEVLFFSFLPLFLISALRYDVGEDYLKGYVSYFEMVQLNILPQNRQMEFLFHLLNIVVSRLGGSYVWVFAVCAFLFYALIIDQILLDSPDPALSIFLLMGMGYVFISFNAMRQMVGCAILFWSLRFVKQRRFLPFALCVLAATGFHTTCCFFFVAYWVTRIRIKPVTALILTGIVLVMSRVIRELILYFMKQTIYSVYLSPDYEAGQQAWVTIAIHLVLFVLYSLCYKEDKQTQMYYNLFLFSIWISFFSGSIVLSIRLMWMFSLPSIISLPFMIHHLEEKKNRELLKAGVILFYSLYTLITVGLQNSNSVLPYQTVLQRWL